MHEAAVAAEGAAHVSVVAGTQGSVASLGLLEQFLEGVCAAAHVALPAASLPQELLADRTFHENWLIAEIAGTGGGGVAVPLVAVHAAVQTTLAVRLG